MKISALDSVFVMRPRLFDIAAITDCFFHIIKHFSNKKGVFLLNIFTYSAAAQVTSTFMKGSRMIGPASW
jgi:uncharacterized membrane protein